MSARNIGVVYRKELIDSLRDRRTIISMVVIPTLLMPLLTLGVGAVSAVVFGRAMQETPTVMVLGGENSPKIVAALAGEPGLRLVRPSPDFAQLISDKKLRAAVRVPADFDDEVARGQTADVRIYLYQGEIRSGFGAERLEQFFREFRQRQIAQRLQTRRLPASLADPVQVAEQNVAPPERVGGTLIGGLIPYFVIIFALTGAMYPAIDLTAGEKERGTMETILCSPVSRTHLVLGKFFMVLTASLAAVLLSMVSMAITIGGSNHVLQSMPRLAQVAQNVPLAIHLGALFWVFLMIVPLAVLFSAALLAIALFAKSYKEAQSYISPLAIVVLLPAILSLLPGVELDARLALVPILNSSLASKEIVAGIYHWGDLAVILISSCAYAAAALWIAVRLFQREDVLFRS